MSESRVIMELRGSSTAASPGSPTKTCHSNTGPVPAMERRLNECLVAGFGSGDANGRVWVLAAAKLPVGFRPYLDALGKPSYRKQPFVQRDLSRFSVSHRQFREEQSGTGFGEVGPADGRQQGRRGGFPVWVPKRSGRRAICR